MLPKIEDISKRRKMLGLKQRKLANISGVSQSFIAKLESGKIRPSYENMKKIVEALERKEHENETIAKDISQKKVIYIKFGDKFSTAIRLMKKHSISQIPVLDGKRNVGSISDKDILERIIKGDNMTELSMRVVEEIMNDAFPQIPEDTPVKALTELLKHNQALMTMKKGRITGIITKADLLNAERV